MQNKGVNQERAQNAMHGNMRGIARGSLGVTTVPCPDQYRRTQVAGGGFQNRSSDVSEHFKKSYC